MPEHLHHHFESFDGIRIAWCEIGRGRPLVLLHGLFSNAQTNWVKWGIADALAGAGIRVIMPDHRAHGASQASHDPAAYPRDVLARDVVSLTEHLGLGDFDLGGYSLGARTAIRAVVLGLRPRRVILGGMGLDGVLHTRGRTEFFLRVIETHRTAKPGTREWMAAQFMKTTGIDVEAAVHVVTSELETTREELAALTMPVLVVSGEQDRDNGSAEDLAAALPNAEYASVPGNHMSAVMKPEIGRVMAEFLNR